MPIGCICISRFDTSGYHFPFIVLIVVMHPYIWLFIQVFQLECLITVHPGAECELTVLFVEREVCHVDGTYTSEQPILIKHRVSTAVDCHSARKRFVLVDAFNTQIIIVQITQRMWKFSHHVLSANIVLFFEEIKSCLLEPSFTQSLSSNSCIVGCRKRHGTCLQ